MAYNSKKPVLWIIHAMRLKIIPPLPGKDAQLEMAPENRRASLRRPPPPNARDAAVLILLGPRNRGASPCDLLDWTTLLIRRNTYPGVHSGQIALPGGKCDEGDNSPWATACRESFEEVGVRAEDVAFAGALSSIYIPPSNFLIHPFVGLRLSDGPLTPDPREVVDIKQVPLRVFNPDAASLVDPGHEGYMWAPAWLYEGYTIWGATAMILAELYRLIEGGGLAQA